MTLSQALLKARRSMSMPTKNSSAQMGGRGSYKYADLATVLDCVTPPLLEAGIVLRQYPIFSNENWILVTELVHAESGESACFHFPLLVAKQDCQGFGSSYTYARRYSILGLLGLAPEDDDGKTACSPVTAKVIPMEASSSKNWRKEVCAIVSGFTESDKEIVDFIEAVSKKTHSEEAWQRLASDSEKLRGYFNSWQLLNNGS